MAAAFDIAVDAPSMAVSGFGDQFFRNSGDFIIGADQVDSTELLISGVIGAVVLIVVAGINRAT